MKKRKTKEDVDRYAEEINFKEEECSFSYLDNLRLSLEDANINLKEILKKHNIILKEEEYENYKCIFDLLQLPVDNGTSQCIHMDIFKLMSQKKQCKNHLCKKYNDISNKYCVYCGYKF